MRKAQLPAHHAEAGVVGAGWGGGFGVGGAVGAAAQVVVGCGLWVAGGGFGVGGAVGAAAQVVVGCGLWVVGGEREAAVVSGGGAPV